MLLQSSGIRYIWSKNNKKQWTIFYKESKCYHFCKETHITVLYCIISNINALNIEHSAEDTNNYLYIYIAPLSRALLYAFLYKNGEIWNRIFYDIHMKGYFFIDKI